MATATASKQLRHNVPLELDAHGVYRVGGTRVTLESVLHAFHEGASSEEIVWRFPTLSLPDVYATISAYLQNQEEFDAYLERADEESEAVRAEIQKTWMKSDLRKKLLAARAKRR